MFSDITRRDYTLAYSLFRESLRHGWLAPEQQKQWDSLPPKARLSAIRTHEMRYKWSARYMPLRYRYFGILF